MRFVSVRVGVDGDEEVRAKYLPPQRYDGQAGCEFFFLHLGEDLTICGDPHAVVNVLRQAADLAAEALADARRQEMRGQAVAS